MESPYFISNHIAVITMFKTLNEKVENFRRELGIIRLKILGLKNAVTEIKNSVDKFTH